MNRPISFCCIFLAVLIQSYGIAHEFQHSQSHTIFIPQQSPNASNTHFSAYSSVNTKAKRNYYANYLTSIQQLNIVKNWIKYYFQTDTIPYGYLQPIIQTSNAQSTKEPEKITETIFPAIYETPYILQLEDELFIQQQCIEWENHTAILDTRHKAFEQIKNGHNEITRQHHIISHTMQRYCNAYGINSDKLKQCTGSIVQQIIHHEFIEITKKSSHIWHTYKTSKTFKKATHIIADFTNAGIKYNNNNNNEIHHALHLANACWMILDCIQAAGEGLIDGAYHIVDDIIHPMRTAQNIAESAAICGYYIGKVAIEVGKLGYLAIIEPPDRVDEKLAAWKYNFSLIYDAIQEKRSTLKTRDIVKETVSLGVQFYTAPKVLHGLGTLFKQAQKHVITFAKNIPALAKTNALTTPEGVIVRIADSAAEYMKSTQAIAREFIIKANNMTEFFELPFGQKFRDRCIKTKKIYKI